jgi:hypothetical protein|tara:strand:- start:66 stop:197 length:132 start_codon:yes stop_codon:yes gene_type:complete
MYKAFIKNPAYKSIGSSETIHKVESIAPEEKKTKLQFIMNWFF